MFNIYFFSFSSEFQPPARGFVQHEFGEGNAPNFRTNGRKFAQLVGPQSFWRHGRKQCPMAEYAHGTGALGFADGL